VFRPGSLNFSASGRDLLSVGRHSNAQLSFMNDIADSLYEQVLVLRCQTGDGAAFGELVERFASRLRYYVRTLLGKERQADAEDVLQDVWLDAHRSIATLTDPGALAAWLYRVARNRTVRHLRKRVLPTLAIEDVQADSEIDRGGDFSIEDAEAIHLAMESLAPEHREVLVLRFLEEMSYDGIATVTGCPVGTVRSRIHYAKLALRRVMETNDHDAERSRQGALEARRDRIIGPP
jgi:RNA polymerase sigma-70 factor (ECF subfamily)